jgi:hypothetical protein
LIRIFFTLAVFAVLCLLVAMFLGWYIGDLQQVYSLTSDAKDAILRRKQAHMLFGIGAALVVLLVNSIVVTYFIGTGRWCKEVVETYSLDRSLVSRSQKLKRQSFPWAVCSMVAVIVVVALGGAADPTTGAKATANWVMPHYIGALSTLAFIVFAFFVEGGNIRAHHNVINDIVAEVRRVRSERGLEV